MSQSRDVSRNYLCKELLSRNYSQGITHPYSSKELISRNYSSLLIQVLSLCPLYDVPGEEGENEKIIKRGNGSPYNITMKIKHIFDE